MHIQIFRETNITNVMYGTGLDIIPGRLGRIKLVIYLGFCSFNVFLRMFQIDFILGVLEAFLQRNTLEEKLNNFCRKMRNYFFSF